MHSALHVPKQNFTGIAKLNFACAAMKQNNTELFFQIANLHAKRGLRSIQSLCGSSKILQFRDSDKGA